MREHEYFAEWLESEPFYNAKTMEEKSHMWKAWQSRARLKKVKKDLLSCTQERALRVIKSAKGWVDFNSLNLTTTKTLLILRDKGLIEVKYSDEWINNRTGLKKDHVSARAIIKEG